MRRLSGASGTRSRETLQAPRVKERSLVPRSGPGATDTTEEPGPLPRDRHRATERLRWAAERGARPVAGTRPGRRSRHPSPRRAFGGRILTDARLGDG